MVHLKLITKVNGFIQFDIKLDVLGFPHSFQRKYRLSDLLIQIEELLIGRNSLVFNLGHEENAASQVGKPLGIKKDFLYVELLGLIQVLTAL